MERKKGREEGENGGWRKRLERGMKIEGRKSTF